MYAKLNKSSLINEQVYAFAGSELLGSVLRGDLLLTPTKLCFGAALSELLNQWAQKRGGLFFAHRPFHSGSRFSKKAETPSWRSSVENASVRL
ncbi:unannotated protein [freshwater metagenome]|uniref:Unannotated protein n=1 Tax=freshwater metagenome TaxID=449393 RepID=A0A6J7E478_9ZZZZ